MQRPLVALSALALLFSAACGGGSGGGSGNRTPTATSTPAATPTVLVSRTPAAVGLLDDVINLAAQLKSMTLDQATCVFRDHPSIYEEFLQTSGLNRSGTLDEAHLKQQLEDLKRKHAVQLDRCFTNPGG